MARKRMIDPNFWESVDVWKLTVRQRLLAIALFSLADDEGRGTADPLWLKVKVFPHDEEVKVRDIEDDLRNIEKNLSLVLYEVNGKKFYTWKNWTKWQKVEKKTKSVIPGPPEGNIPRPFGEDSGNSRGEVGEYSEPNIIEENMKGIEGKGIPFGENSGNGIQKLLQQKLEVAGYTASPAYIQQVETLQKEYSEELIAEAIEIAFSRQRKPAVNYIRGILNSWKEKGLNTVDAVRQAEGRWTEDEEAAQELATYELRTYKPEDIPRPRPKPETEKRAPPGDGVVSAGELVNRLLNPS